jgi:hypothetical protein
MLSPNHGATEVWRLLEEAYLDSGSQLARVRYSHLSDNDKRTALVEFAREPSSRSDGPESRVDFAQSI